MPIKGLTDRGMSFPEIGVIRKGKKVTKQRANGTTYEVPVDLQYFRVDLDVKETEALERFNNAYRNQNGEVTPDEINIMLPFDEIERCWDAWMEAYTAGRMVARSDGEYFAYRCDLETGEIIVKDGINIKTGQPEPHRDHLGKVGKTEVICKPTGRLKVIIPELQRLAYLTVKTTSYYDVINISEQLQALKNISGGILKGIPLVLRRRPKMISTPGADGKRTRREKWLISIEADPRWVQPKFDEAFRLAMPSGAQVMELPERVPVAYEIDEDEYVEGDLIEEYDNVPVEKTIYPAHSTNHEVEDPGCQDERDDRNPAQVARQEILDMASNKYAGKQLTEKQAKAFPIIWRGLFEFEDERYDVTEWLFGVRSSNEITDPQAKALLDWMELEKDPETGYYVPGNKAVQISKSMIAEARKASGQQVMDL